MGLKLLFVVFCRRETGYGHWYRSMALAQTASQRGYSVTIAGDRNPGDLPYSPIGYNDPVSYKQVIEATKPDWVFVDLPGVLPAWVRSMTPGKICTLNGIGYNQNDGADLRVIQGMADVELPGEQDKVPVLKGREYVILRPELQQYKGAGRGDETVLWGGGMDVLGLHSRFFAACPGRFAVHLISEMILLPLLNGPTQTCIRVRDGSIMGWIASSRAFVTAMGMVCWEAAYLGLPQWVFSASDLHLRFARAMDKGGLIKAYPTIGLPKTNEEFRGFIDSSFMPTGEPPDLDGARRVLEAIENG